MGQVEFLAALYRDGGAEHATGMEQHKVHLLCRHLLSGDDQVAFVLTVLVVDHNHELSLLEVFYGFLYRVKFHFFGHVYTLLYYIVVSSRRVLWLVG